MGAESDYLRVQDLYQPPLTPWAVRLTWFGLLPFLIALAAWGWGLRWPSAGDAPDLLAVGQRAFLLYSAVILSFLGGVRWGRAMAAGSASAGYVLAVLPSLWAFPALFLPPEWAVAALAAGFALALWFDTSADPLPATPGFRRMRVGISAAVLVCHAAALALLLLATPPAG